MQIGSSQTCKYKPIKCIFAFLCWAVELALEYSWRRGLNHKPVKLVVVAQWCCFDRWWWCILLGWQIGVAGSDHLGRQVGVAWGSHRDHLWNRTSNGHQLGSRTGNHLGRWQVGVARSSHGDHLCSRAVGGDHLRDHQPGGGWQIGVLWLNHLALNDLRLNLNPRNGDHLGSHHLHLGWQIGSGQRSGTNHSQQSHCKSHEDYTLSREKLSISPQFEIIKKQIRSKPTMLIIPSRTIKLFFCEQNIWYL